MVMVTLSAPVLSDPLDSKLKVSPVGWDRKETTGVDSIVEQYATGRRAVFTFPGDDRSLDLVFYGMTRTDKQLMENWLGKVILFRDRHSRKRYGVITQLEILDFRDSEYDVSFTFEVVTVKEGPTQGGMQ